jgi:hypothetical protein
MSNHLAIATVTAALGQLVHSAAQSAVSGVELRFGRPSLPSGASDRKKVHLYLYQVAANASLRNLDLPTRNAEGQLVTRPHVAIDLYYLLTFYGDDQQLEPDRMLGSVVRTLHARAVLTSQAIQNAVASNAVLNGSNLATAIERVKFTPLPLSLDEMSKLWSVFVQTPHALSVAYLCTVVLIEADEAGQPALPVLRRGEDDRGVETRIGPFPRLIALHIGTPVAEAIQPRLPSYPNAQLGLRLTFVGENLGGDEVRLLFSHPLRPVQEIVIAATERTATEVRCTLPDDASAQSAWAAGILSAVAIVKRGRSIHTSNALPLPLAARITGISPNPVARDANGTATFTLTCRPHVLPAQSATVLLADRELPAQPLAAASDTLTFAVTDAPALSSALLQLRVDGVGSLPFEFDEARRRLAFDDDQRITIT